MYTFIVPTDFSTNAHHAVQYAGALAEKLAAKIVLLHVFWVPVYVDERETSDAIQKKESRLHTIAQQTIVKLVEELAARYPQAPVEFEIRNGFVADEIVTLADERNAACIIMGTQGASGWRELVLGTNTADVIERANCPVMAIPKMAQWHDLKQITLAADFNIPAFSNPGLLVSIAHSFRSRLTLLHVSDIEPELQTVNTLQHWFHTRTAGEMDPEDIRYQILSGTNVLKEIGIYLQENTVDLLIMITRKRTFAGQIFSPSLSRQEALRTRIPLLILQAKEAGSDNDVSARLKTLLT